VNMAIAFFVGCITFVLMMIIKVPIKKLNLWLVEKYCVEEEQQLIYKRLNVSIMVVAIVVSMLCFYVVARMFEIENIKWCCAIKGGTIAIALHTIYAQWFEPPQNE